MTKYFMQPARGFSFSGIEPAGSQHYETLPEREASVHLGDRFEAAIFS